MSFLSKPVFRSIVFLLIFFFAFNFILSSNVNAATTVPQKAVQKQKLKADIGELPAQLPSTKLELKDKRTEYSTRFLNPDGSFTEEIYSEPKFYQDPSDKEWKEIDNNLKSSSSVSL